METDQAVTGRSVIIEPDVQKVIRYMEENIVAARLVGVAAALPDIARLAWGHIPQEPCVAVQLTAPMKG
jgi:hypothetical protein